MKYRSHIFVLIMPVVFFFGSRHSLSFAPKVLVVVFSEQYAHNRQRTKYHSLRGHHQKYFLTYPGRTRANLPLALEKKPRTVVCGQLSNPFSQFFFVKSPPIFSPTLDGVTPNPSLNLHLSAIKRGPSHATEL